MAEEAEGGVGGRAVVRESPRSAPEPAEEGGGVVVVVQEGGQFSLPGWHILLTGPCHCIARASLASHSLL